MTALDAAVLALLVLIGFGGYHQGLIRGLTRAGVLFATAGVALLLSNGLTILNSIRAVILRTLALIGAVLVFNATLIWLINRLIPRSFHQSLINKLLGVVPAVVQGLIVVCLVLGLAHRLVLSTETQQYIASGVVTGPLIEPFNWLERSLAGIP